jgi:short subunit dehydrogenase-like uncharacterized protein
VVEFYLKEYGTTAFKWAVAGRSQAKLEAVKQQLAAKFPEATVCAWCFVLCVECSCVGTVCVGWIVWFRDGDWCVYTCVYV